MPGCFEIHTTHHAYNLRFQYETAWYKQSFKDDLEKCMKVLGRLPYESCHVAMAVMHGRKLELEAMEEDRKHLAERYAEDEAAEMAKLKAEHEEAMEKVRRETEAEKDRIRAELEAPVKVLVPDMTEEELAKEIARLQAENEAQAATIEQLKNELNITDEKAEECK